MSLIKKFGFGAGLCLALFSSAFAYYSTGDDSTGRDDTRSFHLASDLEMDSSVHFKYAKPRIVIKAIYPEFQSEARYENTNTLNQIVTDIVKEESTAFQNRVAELRGKNLEDVPQSKQKNMFYIDYSSSSGTIGKHFVVSLRFSMQGNIPTMAHPYHYHRVVNYDLTTGQPLMLSDLFAPNSDYLSVLSTYARNVLSKRLQNQDMIQKGTQPLPENFKNWNFGPNGLMITFEEYQVAPYVNGAQTILIPYSALKSLILKDSPLYNCINKNRTCMINTVKTGGFIDEL